ncbi:MAG: hypothetical protein JWO06_3940 [Bacteroidota bacterium]|nr:hypothetical protein [Bacteroidota bacterium]
MLAKINLEGTRNYEIAIAAKLCSEMLDNFIIGNDGIAALGSEQGIPKWDDIATEDYRQRYNHVQIKRNTSDFSTENITRRPDKAGNPWKLCPLEESIEQLGEWTRANSTLTNHAFTIYLPDGEVLLKKDIKVRHLMVLCSDLINDHTTLPLFNNLLTSNTSAKNITDWWKNWCGFNNDDEILKALKLLKIERIGNQSEIDNDTLRILDRYYSNKNDVLALIKQFFVNNSTFTSALTPKAIFHELEHHLKPDISRWTQYFEDSAAIMKTGIGDSTSQQIEDSSIIVPRLWGDRNDTNVIKIGLTPNFNAKLPVALARLVLHLGHVNTGHFENVTIWEQTISDRLGGTVGTSESDTQGLPFIEKAGPRLKTGLQSFDTPQAKEAEADALHKAMNDITWDFICADVTHRFDEDVNAPLREAMHIKWQIWKNDLTQNLTQREDLLNSLLHPAAEGKEISAALRVGPKTVKLLGRGLFYLLAVATTFGPDATWSKLSEEYSIQLRANSYWSGPAGEGRKPRKIAHFPSLDQMLAAESTVALLISETESSPETLRNPLMSGNIPSKSLAAERRPKLIITGCDRLAVLIKIGDINGLKVYIQSQIQ